MKIENEKKLYSVKIIVIDDFKVVYFDNRDDAKFFAKDVQSTMRRFGFIDVFFRILKKTTRDGKILYGAKGMITNLGILFMGDLTSSISRSFASKREAMKYIRDSKKALKKADSLFKIEYTTSWD